MDAIKPFHLVYIVCFDKTVCKPACRDCVRTLAGALARLRGIDFAIAAEDGYGGVPRFSVEKELRGETVDYLHFRSRDDTEVSATVLKTTMRRVFQYEYDSYGPIDITLVGQRHLKKFPWPRDIRPCIIVRPLRGAIC